MSLLRSMAITFLVGSVALCGTVPFGKAEEPRWSDLDFSNNRRVQKVQVIIFKKGDFGDEREHKLNVSSEDKAVLELAQNGLQFYAWRSIVSKDVTGGFASQPYGEVHLTTTTEKIVVTLDRGGFAVSPDYSTPHAIFYSWCLAEAIDRILTRQGSGLSDDQFKRLSGEYLIELQKRQYKRSGLNKPER